MPLRRLEQDQEQ